jgi:hypothetical protein
MKRAFVVVLDPDGLRPRLEQKLHGGDVPDAAPSNGTLEREKAAPRHAPDSVRLLLDEEPDQLLEPPPLALPRRGQVQGQHPFAGRCHDEGRRALLDQVPLRQARPAHLPSLPRDGKVNRQLPVLLRDHDRFRPLLHEERDLVQESL